MSGFLRSSVEGLIRGIRGGKSVSRQPLTSKRSDVNFYKGNKARVLGFKTTKGQFVLEKEKVPKLIVPDLTGFELKPYVAPTLRKSDYLPEFEKFKK
jgi:large subunit ribosomal protein L41